MTLRFGTDGVRGDAETQLGTDFVVALGQAVAEVLGGGGFVIGRDTRESGPRLAGDLDVGLRAGGAEPRRLGVVPTPAVAFACAADGVAGAMVSASHNPWADNGIKVFASGGRKLDDDAQAAIEDRLEDLLAAPMPAPDDRADGTGSGDVGAPTSDGAEVLDRWAVSLAASIDGRRLDGLRLVVDGANGAAALVAPDVLRSLGAEASVLHAEPDGRNINEGCGSTHPDDLQAAVVEQGADLGLAFDGDADRVLAVDAAGRLIDGDQLIGICAIDRHQRGLLVHDTVVVTVMTNLGFHHGMAAHGIEVVVTPVGDRAVLEAMEAGGHALGGEQSGHVIFADHATTGDGLLSALQLLDVVVRSGRSLADLADAAMVRLPQVLRNVRVAERDPAVVEHLADAIAASEARLGDDGRVLVRPSGTEPLVRIMVEAPTAEQAEAEVAELEAALHALLG